MWILKSELQNHLPFIYFVDVTGRQYKSLLIQFDLHIYKNKKANIKPSMLVRQSKRRNQIYVTKSVAVRRQNFGSKVRTGTEQVHQSVFHRVVQKWIHWCLQGASRLEEGLDPVFVRKSGTLRRQQNTSTFTQAPTPKHQHQSSWLLQTAGMQRQVQSEACVQVSSLRRLHPSIIWPMLPHRRGTPTS